MKKIDHSLLILCKNFENSDRSMYAICVGWVNFVHSLRCLLKNLRSQQKFYATAGRTGRDKYHLCLRLHHFRHVSFLFGRQFHAMPAMQISEKSQASQMYPR